MSENLLVDNEFILKVRNKEKIKEIKLKPYSFSIQLKLMKSGLVNKLIGFQKKSEKFDPANIDFVLFGEMLETSIEIIYEMLPDDIKITKTKENIIDTIVDGEPMRFIQWIFTQFGKTSSFLGQENLKKGASQQS